MNCNISDMREVCLDDGSPCEVVSQCLGKEISNYCHDVSFSSRYDDPSASWVVTCAILMFFMKAGFLFVELAFSVDGDMTVFRRRVVLAKYIDIFAGTLGFWLFGYALSGNTDRFPLGEEQDFLFWFFRFTFATNTATILGGTLVGQSVQMRTCAIFVYSFFMTAFIHPSLARFFWSSRPYSPLGWASSPYAYCNGTFTTTHDHNFTILTDTPSGFVFIDYAGSGLVHLCGGIGGFVLAVFHKLEITKKLKHIRECGGCCNSCLVREGKVKAFRGKRGKQGKEESEQNQLTDTRAGQEEDPEQVPEKPRNFIEWMYPSAGGTENVEYAALGILILWTTWFAFNGGSTEKISEKAMHATVGRIALVMSVACASAGTVQVFVAGLVQMYKRDTNFNTNEIANVVLGTLVAVTGCCPFIEPPFALLIGVLTVGVYHLGCFIEYVLHLHDGARIFPVHGMCGFWGVLCVGLFSKACYIRELYDNLCFCVQSCLPPEFDDGGKLFGYQMAGGLFISLWSFLLCSIIFLTLWFFPVKALLTCLPWVFCFNDKKRGKIEFTGNVLFTHFDEIGQPHKAKPYSPVASYESITGV